MIMPSAHLRNLMHDSARIVNEALATHLEGRELTGKVVLYSGGNDSTALTHLFRNWVTHAAHANTTIGVERTRMFVRSTCIEWGVPLIERSGPDSYRDLVVGVGGFPGPAMYFKMYQRLKEKALREVRRELVKNGRKQRVLFIAGRRRAESKRRQDVPEHERIDSVIWASPFAHWEKRDLEEYRETYGVPENPIAKALGMSGECLCGAFAEPGEFERIEEVDPDAAEIIREIERALHEAGHEGPRCQWGWGAYRSDPNSQPPKSGPLCSSCDARFSPGPASDEVKMQAQLIMDRVRMGREARGGALV